MKANPSKFIIAVKKKGSTIEDLKIEIFISLSAMRGTLQIFTDIVHEKHNVYFGIHDTIRLEPPFCLINYKFTYVCDL